MIIPIGTDYHTRRRPIVNETLIIVNLLVYLAGVAGHYFHIFDFGELQNWGHYDPRDFKAWQLLTYQFMHDPVSIWHILFNMLFLWVFGNGVEDRLGRFGYLGFYLIAGIVAGIVHGMVDGAPIIGASGSIAGVSGAFLALFPRSRVRIIFFLFGILAIPALWFIGFYFVLDVVKQTVAIGRGNVENVAYMAHIAGYLYGFFLCFALLGLKVIKREDMDVFFLFKQMRRRQAFRASVQKTPAVWDQPKADTAEQLAKRKEAKPLSERQRRHAEERAEIARLLSAHDIAGAAAKYRDLLARAPKAVMPENRQLDLANQFYAEGDVATAQQTYELLLEAYPTCRDAVHVKLLLALIYTRHGGDRSQARSMLEEIKHRLNGHDRELADQLLADLEGV